MLGLEEMEVDNRLLVKLNIQLQLTSNITSTLNHSLTSTALTRWS